VALFLSSPPLRAAALVEQGRDGKAVLNDLTEKAPYKFGPICRRTARGMELGTPWVITAVPDSIRMTGLQTLGSLLRRTM